MANSYYEGQQVRVKVTFTVARTPTDPSTVVAKIKDPSTTVTTYTYGTDAELVKETTGVYYVDVATTAVGTWTYRFAGTGTAAAAAEGTFTVTSSF